LNHSHIHSSVERRPRVVDNKLHGPTDESADITSQLLTIKLTPPTHIPHGRSSQPPHEADFNSLASSLTSEQLLRHCKVSFT